MRPSEDECDAAASIGDHGVGLALYALVHEHGEPWFEMPGVDVLSGERAYLAIDPAAQPAVAEDEFLPSVPEGEILFSEGW